MEKQKDNIEKLVNKEIDLLIPKIKCELCGKIVNKVPNSSNQKYCKECKNKAKKIRNRKWNKLNTQEKKKESYDKGNKHIEKRRCVYCGKIRYDYKILGRKFCGRKCLNKWKSENFEPKNKQNIKVHCRNCNKEIVTNKCSLRNGRKFCSRKCFEEDRKKNWKFPHKGKSVLEWVFKGDGGKYKKYRENLRRSMLNFYKEHPEFISNRKGKTLIEIYGEERAKEMIKLMNKGRETQWKIPENRERLLKSNGRFKKGMKPWNTGKKINYADRISKNKENEFLRKLGIKHYGD